MVNVSSSAGHLSRICGQEPKASELRSKLSSDSLTEDELDSIMNEFVKLVLCIWLSNKLSEYSTDYG